MATNDDNTFPTSPSSLGTGTTGGSSMGSSSMGSSTLGSSLDDDADMNEGGVPRSGSIGSSSSSGLRDAGSTTTGDDMLNRVVQGAHQAIDRLAETAAPHVHRLSEGMQSSTGHVREVGEEWTESLRTTVRDNPLAAVATALAVGLLIARITR